MLTDTNNPACTISIMYAPETAPKYLHSSQLRDKPDHAESMFTCRRPLAVIRSTEFGDYAGTDVERSNHRVLLADPVIAPNLVEIVGSHGYQALAYDAYLGPVPLCEPLAEILAELEHYPVINDHDCAALEHEMWWAAWNDWGRDDFAKALAPVLDVLDQEHEHDLGDGPTEADELDDIWCAGCAAYNINGGNGHVIEPGGGVHFQIAELCAALARSPHSGRGQIAVVQRTLRDRLVKFAVSCRCGEVTA